MDPRINAVTLPGTLDALSPIRDYVKVAAESAGLDHSAVYNLCLAVDEIATNVILHGYEEAGLKGEITLAATNQDDNLVIRLGDTGKAYDPHAHRQPDDVALFKELTDRPIGGLGIMLAMDGVDDLQYESTEQGNVHSFFVKLKPAHQPAAKPASAPEVSDERRKLEILLKISKSLGQEIQLDPLLKLMVAEVTAAMQAERSSLFLVDPKTGELVTRVAEGLKAKEIRIAQGVGIAGATAQTRQTINIPDAYLDSRFNPTQDKSSGFRTRSILSTPIIGQSGELRGVVQVLNKTRGGAFTHEDEQFLDAICVHLGIALHRAEMVETYLQDRVVMQSLELAREIQMGLVPKDFPALPEFKEVDIFATIIPALDVGGDLYDFFPLDRNRISFIIGDVSDKGIPAALFMAMARTAFKMAALASPESIAVALARVNQFLCESNRSQMFVTAFAGILDLRTGEVEYADAGHEPPFILRSSGLVLELEKVGGVALGVIPGREYRSGKFKLETGDALVLYTDGVTEAMNADRHLFGAPAIGTTLAKAGRDASAEAIITTLLEDVHVFVGEAHQSDDITVLVLRYCLEGRNTPTEKRV